MRKILFVIMASIIMTSIAGAFNPQDPIIYPLVDTIPVNLDPKPISPPISIEYDGWNYNTNCGSSGTDACSTWWVNVTNDVTGALVCYEKGNITSDPFVLTLPTCKIPASSYGVAHTIKAFGDCTRDNCGLTPKRSKTLKTDAGLNPTPELSPAILTGIGIIGLVGLTRYRRKE